MWLILTCFIYPLNLIDQPEFHWQVSSPYSTVIYASIYEHRNSRCKAYAIDRNSGLNIFNRFFCFVDLSFCFWINLNNLRTSKILDHQPKNKQGFGFTLQKDYGFLNLKNVDLLFDYNFFHVPNRWEFLQCDNVILN